MQGLVNAVRATGATNVIMVGGLTWTNDLTEWLTYKPTDPPATSWRPGTRTTSTPASTESCWDSQIGTVAAQVPVVAGEIGQNTCAHDYIDQVMAWADAHGVGYLAWTWNPWGCSPGNVLINDYTGTPTSPASARVSRPTCSPKTPTRPRNRAPSGCPAAYDAAPAGCPNGTTRPGRLSTTTAGHFDCPNNPHHHTGEVEPGTHPTRQPGPQPAPAPKNPTTQTQSPRQHADEDS